MSQPESLETTVAVMKSTLARIEQAQTEMKSDVKDILTQTSDNYVSKTEFNAFKEEMSLVKQVVYGFVGMVLVAVTGAIVTLVVKR